jgi:hypothetical protein
MVLLSGCSSKLEVCKQSVPISSIPLGAEVYVNGQKVGVTPLSVDLERNRNHLISLSKPGYESQNISILKKRDDTKFYSNAALSGLNAGLFFNNPQWGVNNARYTIEEDEKTGKSFMLEPGVVTIQLQPEALPPTNEK